MLGLFKSRKSPIRQRLQKLLVVRRSWFEWTIENGRQETVLVIEYAYDTDPRSPDYFEDGIAEITAALQDGEPDEVKPTRVRVIPRMYEG